MIFGLGSWNMARFVSVHQLRMIGRLDQLSNRFVSLLSLNIFLVELQPQFLDLLLHIRHGGLLAVCLWFGIARIDVHNFIRAVLNIRRCFRRLTLEICPRSSEFLVLGFEGFDGDIGNLGIFALCIVRVEIFKGLMVC